MPNNDMLILKGEEVRALLHGQEREIMRIVQGAYQAHNTGSSSLPQSTFLRFPQDARNRIIALPAYLGREFEVAGVKWISSFPSNHDLKLDRASAIIILNSTETGIPTAVIEGSIISAKRTAASAALAAQYLQGRHRADDVGMIGCGPINFEIARFLLHACPEIRTIRLFDMQAGNAEMFKNRCHQLTDDIEIVVMESADDVLHRCPLVSFATTASTPHIFKLSPTRRGGTLLHVSLRDLSPEVILSCDNVVDDVEHVCRAQTSLHLVEQIVGHREFIRCSLADVLSGASTARKDEEVTVVFSPFGLGVLDLAVSQFVWECANREKVGTIINSFLPVTWAQQRDS